MYPRSERIEIKQKLMLNGVSTVSLTGTDASVTNDEYDTLSRSGFWDDEEDE